MVFKAKIPDVPKALPWDHRASWANGYRAGANAVTEAFDRAFTEMDSTGKARLLGKLRPQIEATEAQRAPRDYSSEKPPRMPCKCGPKYTEWSEDLTKWLCTLCGHTK